MEPADFEGSQSDIPQDSPPIQCDACQSVLDAGGQQAISYLLLDQFTMPVLSCEDHLEQFISVCELTTDDTADLLQHHPAGGIRCPACRHASRNPSQPLIPVQDGAITVLGCPKHQSEIISRFHTGLETQQQLTSSLGTNPDLSL